MRRGWIIYKKERRNWGRTKLSSALVAFCFATSLPRRNILHQLQMAACQPARLSVRPSICLSPMFCRLPLLFASRYSHADDVGRSSVCAEAVAYTFGHAGGVIVYSFPDYELPDARRDELALGVVTSQRSAVILRVVSGSSSDFIEMELVRMQPSPPSRPR